MRRRLSPRPRLSKNLVLRPFGRRDVDPLLEAVKASMPDLGRWLPWARHGYGRPDAAAFLRESQTAWADGRAYDFAIRRRSQQDRHLGNVSVWFTSRAAMVGEVGYWVRSDEATAGVGTEVAARVLGVAFDELAMHRVVLRIAAGNLASERIAEKLHFTREGMLREEVLVNGVWLDHSIWGLLDHEYRALQPRYVEAGWL